MITVELMTNTRDTREGEITVYIGLGSNLGNREANLRDAISRIEGVIKVMCKSSIYETEPVGLREQRWFLNQVIEAKISTELEGGRDVRQAVRQAASLSSSPPKVASEEGDKLATCRTSVSLLYELLKIENDLGRARTIVNGPRVIDIDLLLLGDRVIDHSKEDAEGSRMDAMDVFIPHPRMHLRRFVLEPLCEIASEVIHPVLKKTCREILASLSDPSIVRLYDPAAASS